MDYTETFYPEPRLVKEGWHAMWNVTRRLDLKSQLPAHYKYTIWQVAGERGWFRSRSVPGSCGGTRWYTFHTAQEAMDHGFKWARRWQKQLEREHNGKPRRGF